MKDFSGASASFSGSRPLEMRMVNDVTPMDDVMKAHKVANKARR